MNSNASISQFLDLLQESIQDKSLVKLTFSKPSTKSQLRNIYVKTILLKEQEKLKFTYRYQTKDETKNFDLAKGLEAIVEATSSFDNADLLTTTNDYALKRSKKGKVTLLKRAPSSTTKPSQQHNHQKKEWIAAKDNLYLQHLGLTNKKGEVVKQGYRKFRQINKYIEIIEGLLRQHPLPQNPSIVDMGSGKGYLTFALYDYLHSIGLKPIVKGIELRNNLVSSCNLIANDVGYEGLEFIQSDILKYPVKQLDLLIALHACDIATDIAIAKGIQSNASMIVVAPCCHKQIRSAMGKADNLQPLIKHGIHKERIAELITDSIRSLILEANGYQTKVFEFISLEHTSKNIMITATRGAKRIEALEEIKQIKAQFGIDNHYLEQLL